VFFTHNRIDLATYLAQGQPPVDVVQRQQGEHWYVSYQPVDVTGRHGDWAKCCKEQYVRVPLLPYVMPASPELALAFMLQLGLAAGRTLHTPGRSLVRLHLAVGCPVETLNADTPEEQLRYHIGMGFVFR
jgi:hypothetical protein